jgi:membrane-bound inhibitor of C-type lysozyme
MRALRPVIPLLSLLLPAAVAAAPAPAQVVVEPAQAATSDAPLASATSSLVITLGTSGDFDRKSVRYGCEGDADSVTVDYLNVPPNYLALVPIEGSTLVFNTVLSASGAKYAAGKYVWWTKGNDASLYDLTQGEDSKPILTCAVVTETP